MSAPRRIGFIHPVPDPSNQSNWSGTPAALSQALAELGVEVVPISYRMSRLLRGAVLAASSTRGRGAIARGAPLHARVRTRVLAHELQLAGPLDAAIAIGTDLYGLREVVPPGLPVATYDDGTFAQFSRHRDSDLNLHRYPPREISSWLERQAQAARHATACCVSTAWAAQSMIDDYGVSPRRIHIVGMGHRPRALTAPTRNWAATRYLFVGADWQRKNGDAVLAAFREVRHRSPHVLLDLVGDHPTPVPDGVRGHGFLARDNPAAQSRLDRLYELATVFVLPSRFDPSPIACLEAASAGLPVIATSEGGAGELLGRAAIIVNPDDHRQLTEAMRRLADPDTAQRLGAMARSAAAHSSWQAVARRILDALGVSASVSMEASQPASAVG